MGNLRAVAASMFETMGKPFNRKYPKRMMNKRFDIA